MEDELISDGLLLCVKVQLISQQIHDGVDRNLSNTLCSTNTGTKKTVELSLGCRYWVLKEGELHKPWEASQQAASFQGLCISS